MRPGNARCLVPSGSSHAPSLDCEQVRRAAMRLVSLVVLPAGGDGAAALVRMLLTKLRDK